ncbi:hypothetical protein ZWY2020_032647, partial [Hordeum vulgare]
IASSSDVGGGGADGGVGDGPTTLDELYHINVVPAELHFKFRKELQGLRVGINFEFYNLEVNDFEAKVVLKPLDFDRKWQFQYKPISDDIQLLSKKFAVIKYLNLQYIFILFNHPILKFYHYRGAPIWRWYSFKFIWEYYIRLTIRLGWMVSQAGGLASFDRVSFVVAISKAPPVMFVLRYFLLLLTRVFTDLLYSSPRDP